MATGHGVFYPGHEEAMLSMIARQKEDLWRQLVASPVQDLFQVQAEARVLTRMEQQIRDAIANSLSKKRNGV